jgi:hypothetical protein
MACVTLVLHVVTENLSYWRANVYPHFEEDARFNPTWWRDPSAKSPVSYCRFMDGGEEVGRAKVLLGSGSYAGYTTWACPLGGVTEIDLIEIRPDLRRSIKRYGRHAVEAIARHYGEPLVAMSLDQTSDIFWRSLGWTAHTQPEGECYRTLFTSV